MAKIIISYRRSDSVAIAGRICDRLVARYGNDSVFMDVDDIPSAANPREHVRKFLHQGDILLAVVGPNWLAGDGDRLEEIEKDTDLVRLEVEMALEEGIQIIPVLIDGSSLPRAN